MTPSIGAEHRFALFEFNKASARVLEKNGFAYEGLLRKHDRKESTFLNSMAYALVK